MTPTEAVKVTRLVKACCPQQQFDEFTADAWHGLLDDLRLEDCVLAVKAMGRRQPFISPSEIRDEVRRIRNDRLERNPRPEPPAEIADNPIAYLEWVRRIDKARADGTYVASTPLELKRRDMTAIENTFQRPPGAAAARAHIARQIPPHAEEAS